MSPLWQLLDHTASLNSFSVTSSPKDFLFCLSLNEFNPVGFPEIAQGSDLPVATCVRGRGAYRKYCCRRDEEKARLCPLSSPGKLSPLPCPCVPREGRIGGLSSPSPRLGWLRILGVPDQIAVVSSKWWKKWEDKGEFSLLNIEFFFIKVDTLSCCSKVVQTVL